VKSIQTLDTQLIDRTIDMWQPKSRRQLSREDARQIVENVTGFFHTLGEWAKAEALGSASDTNHRPLRGPRGAP
jgi:hypothetical protein